MRAAHVRRGRARGQAISEFALLAVVLLTFLVGIAQVGLLYYDQMSVDTGAREAGRVAAENPGNTVLFSGAYTPSSPRTSAYVCSGSGDAILTCRAAYTSTNNGALGGLINPANLVVSFSGAVYPGGSPVVCSQGTGTSDGEVIVSVSYNAPVFVPLLGALLSTPGHSYRTLTASARVRVAPCNETKGT
jgi:Flp pilus assembly protein TadG